MKRTTVYLVSTLCALSVASVEADVVEWSDITFIEGKYSRIYFDYKQGGGSQNGTFYVINDWMVNREDGGVEGGLNPGEYNRFPFVLDSDNYEIRIYDDGTSDILVNGDSNPSALTNFGGAFSWGTSPSMPTTDHTIWEFKFEIAPTKITHFSGCDPASQSVVYVSPPPPSVVTTGPSAYPHYVDGAFSDFPITPVPATDPARDYLDPVADPHFSGGYFNLALEEYGGVTATFVPLPSAFLLGAAGLTAGIAGLHRKGSLSVKE